jgi:hypothetical protein
MSLFLDPFARRGRRCVAAAAALLSAAGLVLAHPARSDAAGQYVVISCRNSYEAAYPVGDAFGGWVPEVSRLDDSHTYANTCSPSGQGLTMALDGSVTVPVHDYAGWRWVAPPATYITGVDVAFSSYTRPSNGDTRGVFQIAGDQTGIMTSAEAVGNVGATRLTAVGRHDGSVTARVWCDAPDTGSHGPCPAGLNAIGRIGQSWFTVADDHPPVPGNTGGTASDATWKGTKSLSFSGSDLGGGIATLRMYVDGAVQRDRVIDAYGGHCSPVDDGGQWIFSFPKPCPGSVDDSQSIDTTTLTDGAHTVTFKLVDAAGREATLNGPSGTKQVANHPPVNLTAPVYLSPQRAAQPRVGDQLALSDNGTWSGPNVTYATAWQQCDASGNGCVQVPGASGLSYTTTAADVGRRLRYSVTATNPADSVTVSSPLSGIVTAQENSADAPVAKPTDGGNGSNGSNGSNGANGANGAGGNATAAPGLNTTTNTSHTEHTFMGRIAGEASGATCPQDRASLVLEHIKGGRVALRYGATGTAQLLLTCTTNGKAIADAQLQIATRTGAAAAVASDVSTDGAGHAVLRLGKGASRGITVGYRMYADDPISRATASLKVLVDSRLTLKANHKILHNGGAVTLRGRLAGGLIPSRGVSLAVQWKDGRRWRPFAQVKTDRRGTVRYTYRFTRTTKKIGYQLRMQVIKGQVDYPFVATASKPVKVTVAP